MTRLKYRPTDPRWIPARQDWPDYLEYWVPRYQLHREQEHRSFLKGQRPTLTDGAIDGLFGDFLATRTRIARSSRHKEWERWSFEAISVSVDFQPVDRAVLRKAKAPYRVELQWVDRGGRGRKTRLVLQSVQVVADDARKGFPHLGSLDLEQYLAAFWLRLKELGPTESARGLEQIPPLPEPGKPPNVKFYQWLLREYDNLVRKGVRAPAVELARILKVPHSTVKSWRHRAKKILGKEKT